MKILLPSVFLLLFFVESYAQSNKEDFNSFIYEFSTDSAFQASRIKFPLEKISLSHNQMEETSFEIPNNEWKHTYLFINSSSKTQIYDNFEKKLSDTDERVLSFLGTENGLEVYYFFKRLSGTWYMVPG